MCIPALILLAQLSKLSTWIYKLQTCTQQYNRRAQDTCNSACNSMDFFSDESIIWYFFQTRVSLDNFFISQYNWYFFRFEYGLIFLFHVTVSVDTFLSILNPWQYFFFKWEYHVILYYYCYICSTHVYTHIPLVSIQIYYWPSKCVPTYTPTLQECTYCIPV